MYIAKVIGNVVTTQKNENLMGKKLLIVQPLDIKYLPQGECEVAVDSVGAGEGEIVLVVSGSSAKGVFDSPNSPIDRAIVAIVDSIGTSL
ncbi:EutN/CcmL family microcompartment protein [Clostridium malenominatum]|uniref:EutN/CcmL family microcompartment protein n=1 Tax=Clostridium malenominatum TaxID=1539 RepID=A0ABP3U1U2_9CLOT